MVTEMARILANCSGPFNTSRFSGEFISIANWWYAVTSRALL